MNLQSLKLIVCGTDTDVGKTIVSSFLVQGLKAVYWKPIQSGYEDGGDSHTVQQLLNLPPERILPERYKFKAAVSPHWAAEQENQLIESQNLKIPMIKEPLVIETAGGVMVPLTREYLQIDQLRKWMLPVLLVARTGLGTLNHTLLTIEALKKRNIPIIGIILNGPFHPDNPKTLEEISGIDIVAQLPLMEQISSEVLSMQWREQKVSEKLEKLIHHTNTC